MDDKAGLEKVFGRAALKAQAMVNRKVLTDEETLELKGLFQQAKEGDGNNWKILNDPKFFVSSEGTQKNMAWLPLRGMSKQEAMERYIELVEKISKVHHVEFSISRTSSNCSIASTSTNYTDLP